MQKIVLFVVVFFLAFQSCIATSGITSNDIDSNLPTLLMTDAPKIEKEPVRIQSVFGTSNLKEFSLPFEDGYPMGPFEKLDEAQYLFISKCGDIHFAKLDSEIVLTKTGKKLSKFIPGNEKSTVESDAKNVVYCRDLSGVKDSLLINNSLFVAYTVWDDQFNGVRLAVSEFELDKEAHELIFKREIYLSRPAIKEPILGHQVGGKLAVGKMITFYI